MLYVEQNGYIWVCLSDTLGEKKPRMFPYLGDKGWTSFRMKTRFKAPVESCLENFLDCPHATYVHKGWFRSPTDKLVKATVRRLSDGAEAEYFEEPRVRSLVWSFLSPKKSSLNIFISEGVTDFDSSKPLSVKASSHRQVPTNALGISCRSEQAEAIQSTAVAEIAKSRFIPTKFMVLRNCTCDRDRLLWVSSNGMDSSSS